MDSVPQTPKRRLLLIIIASAFGIFFLLTLLAALLPDEPPFDVLKPEDCSNPWMKRELNRRILGHGVIYELNPAGGSLLEGGLNCMAFPQTDRGTVIVTYGFRWIDRAKRIWEFKYL